MNPQLQKPSFKLSIIISLNDYMKYYEVLFYFGFTFSILKLSTILLLVINFEIT